MNPYNLQEVIDELSKHGEVQLLRFGDGNWTCSCKRRDKSTGVSFDIQSEYTHLTHIDAALCCLERLNKTFAAANVSYPTDTAPHVVWDHIDGPVLCLRDGRMQWLSFWEKVLYARGWVTSGALEQKHWNTAGRKVQ